MKILHTSDWHIGKRLQDRERLAEQIEALDEIAELCERENVSLVLVAGDVFDTYLPPAEAEEVFYRAVKKIAGKDRAVVLISGNHDDAVRLSAAAPLAEEQGIYVFGNQPYAFSCNSARTVHPVQSGDNYLVIEDGSGDRVYINALAYPNEARLKEDKTDESYSEKVARWVKKGEEGYQGDIPYILLSHLFVAGGTVSESERDIDLGGARAVPLSALPDHGYIALGHLHKKQKMKNAYYSGSLLQYSFDEANTQKYVLLLETHGKQFDVREIPLNAGKKLVRLECNGVDEALALLPKYEGCLIELTLLLNEPLTSAQTHTLSEANEGLVQLITKVNGGTRAEIVCRSRMSPKELFEDYYRSKYGDLPSDALQTAFLQLLEEA